MGVAISSIIEGKEIKPEDLKGKILAVDAFNTLYMFITTIRGADGSPLMDSKGRITSHLVGLFSRFSNLQEKGIKFIFVFDGESSELKKEEKERRKNLKQEAFRLYEEAKQNEDIENMKKYAARTSILTKEMIYEAKQLINAMGMAVIDAPGEGEAQAAHIVKKGEASAVVSQDADALIFGAPRIIKNLSISRKRKMPGSYSYQTVNPELIELKSVLSSLEINQDQLIALSMLVGTDYNYGGVKGIGPKKGLKLVQKYKNDLESLFSDAKWFETFKTDWKKIFDALKNTLVTDNYKIVFNQPDEQKLIKILVEEHQFSEERVKSILQKLDYAKKINAQKGLNEFFY